MTNFLTGAETGLIGGIAGLKDRKQRWRTVSSSGTRSNEGKVRRLKSPVISARVDLDLERGGGGGGGEERRREERERGNGKVHHEGQK